MLNLYPLYKIILAFFDFTFMIFCYLMCHVIYYNYMTDDIYFFSENYFSIITLSLFLSLFWIFIFQWNNLYKRHIIFSKANQVALIEKSILSGLITLIILQVLLSPLFTLFKDSFFIIFYSVLFFTFISIYRVFIIGKTFTINKIGKIIEEKVLIIGGGDTAKLLAANILNEQIMQSKIIGFINNKSDIGDKIFNDIKNIGHTENIVSIIKTTNANVIYIASENEKIEDLIEFISICLSTNINVNIVSNLLPVLKEKISTENIKEIQVIGNSNRSYWYLVTFQIFSFKISLKRLIDFIFSLILIIILLPAFCIIAFGVKLSSPGKVFFIGDAVGRNGKTFRFYKFRSMKTGSEKDSLRKKQVIDFIQGKNVKTKSTKIVNEKLVTNFGRWIRKYSLDELPQIVNVLKGDMSFVGPRPSGIYEFNAYDLWHKKRLEVSPGITGLWQVSARSQVNFDDMVILDYYYSQNITPWLDLKIILQTIPVIISGKGAK